MRLVGSALTLVIAVTAGPLAAQATGADPSGSEPGSELRVFLVTAGPGDIFWERYGHNAIRVLDTRTGRDVAYNWGIFDFDQVDFIPRFLRGQMLYSMATFPAEPMIAAYAATNRSIVQQELDLTPAQKRTLIGLAEANALPQNRDYIYQYFTDNCSTRVRDLLDQVLGGALSAAFGDVPTDASFRDHARRLSQPDPLISSGLDVLLGSPSDRPISRWDELFVPMRLQAAVREVELPDGTGGTRPLVRSEETLAEASRAPVPTVAERRVLGHGVVGLLLAALIALGGIGLRQGRRTFVRVGLVAGAAWSALAGFLGTILLLLLLATDHTFAYANENVLLFSPLSALLVVGVPLAALREGWRERMSWLAVAVVGLCVIALGAQLLPFITQANARFFALALPPHLALAWLLRELARSPATAA